MQDRNSIEEIKEKLDIVDLISKYIELKPAGRNFTARCPFHNEKTPSFHVSTELQLYKCFGCGKSGDIFSFVMEYEHLDFSEALEKLAKMAGVKLVRRVDANSIKFSILEMINKLAMEFFEKQLLSPTGKTAFEYVKKRKLNEESIKNFHIGYASGGTSLYNYINQKAKFTQSQLSESGLFVERNGTLKDKFYDRIMFPIISSRGKVIGFTGRIIPPHDIGPKYMNTPETPLFQKKDNVFGMFNSKSSIREKDLCILCEGSTDVISCHQNGYKNIVAPLGTSLTKEQVALIKKYTDKVLLFFDSDSAGQAAVERGFKLCHEQGLHTFATTTGKDAKDLDELAQINPQKIGVLIESKIDAFTYLLSKKLEIYDIAEYSSYITVIKYISELLSYVHDKSQINYFIEKASNLTGIAVEKINESITKGEISSTTQPPRKAGNISISQIKSVLKTAQGQFLYYFLLYPKPKYLKAIDKDDFSIKLIQKIFVHIIQQFSDKKLESQPLADYLNKNLPDLLEQEEKDIYSKLIEIVYLDENNYMNNELDYENEIEAIIRKLHKDKVKRRIQHLRQQVSILDQNSSNEKELKALLQEISDLKKQTED